MSPKKSFSYHSLFLLLSSLVFSSAVIGPVVQASGAHNSSSPVESREGICPLSVGRVYPDAVYPVQVVEDIVYGQGLKRSGWTETGGEVMDLTLDAYSPLTQLPELRPAMLLFHGGGFQGGDAGYPNMVAIANYYASRGWVVFSVNYRLEEHHGSFPENWPSDPGPIIYPAGRDAKAAVRWVYANADQYHVSRNHITVLGGSAGGMLSLMLGLSDAADYRSEIDVALDPTLLTTNLEYPAKVQTVIAFWSSAVLLDALEIFDGNYRFDSNDTPTLLAHGTDDTTVPFNQSEIVYQALLNVGVSAEFYPLEGEDHGAWTAHVADGRTLFEAAFDFITLEQDLVVGDSVIQCTTFLPVVFKRE